MPKFRKKPVEIEAIKWTGDNIDQIISLTGSSENLGGPVGGKLGIFTLEGAMNADIGDWIIRGVKGELYPCKPDIFAATYEPI